MRLRIENPIDRDFGMVPRGLWQMDLPFTAKALAAYLLCLRDGAVPYVAEIEAACGIGRDARRKAFAALENAGVIEWRVARDGSGRIVAKTLIIHPLNCHAPENQAGGEIHHAPEKPAGGFPVTTKTEIRPCTAYGSGDTLKEKKQRAAQARKSPRKPSVSSTGGRVSRLPENQLFDKWLALPVKGKPDWSTYRESRGALAARLGDSSPVDAEKKQGGVANVHD